MEHVTTIEIDEREVEITIQYSISKYYPATMYRSNGDPGDPAEGGDLEIESIVDEDGNELDEDVLTDSIRSDLYDNWDEDADNPFAP